MRLILKKPIVLVGMIGTGKSTVGKKLARKLHMQFYDSDQVIEEREGLSIIDIYEFRGESYFKQQEEKVISEIMRYGPVVLSTGGSSFTNQMVHDLVKEKAISIWLYADIDTIFERVSRRNTRPGLHGEDKREVIEDMMQRHHPYLEKADIKVESGNTDTFYIVDNIIAKLKTFSQ
jgi:shikimate kinase